MPEKESEVDIILKKIVSDLTPAVVEILNRKHSGSVELHFNKGDYGSGKKHFPL